MKKSLTVTLLMVLVFQWVMVSCSGDKKLNIGDTEIMKWQDGKLAAVSLTFDDGSINQFRVALPIMDSLEFPATFFIITGEIPGSKYQPGFIGRPLMEIIREAATLPTDEKNLFERASATAYASYAGLREYHNQAGELYESGKIKEACSIIDEAFAKIRNGNLKPLKNKKEVESGKITWNEIKDIAARGHEFASHTITHPRLAVLDSANLIYELEKSRMEVKEKLGDRFTFSAECPFGTENERVMRYALRVYPALRNRMPEPFLGELNRGSDADPGTIHKEYVQWQRGPLTSASMDLMKSWIDTSLVHDNIWLVLVFHGVEGIGWQPRTKEDLISYYGFIKSRENQLWVATFMDVTKYMRERMNARVEKTFADGKWTVHLAHTLDPALYNLPLTLKTYIPGTSKKIVIQQGGKDIKYFTGSDEKGWFVLYTIEPNAGPAEISFN